MAGSYATERRAHRATAEALRECLREMQNRMAQSGFCENCGATSCDTHDPGCKWHHAEERAGRRLAELERRGVLPAG